MISVFKADPLQLLFDFHSTVIYDTVMNYSCLFCSQHLQYFITWLPTGQHTHDHRVKMSHISQLNLHLL